MNGENYLPASLGNKDINVIKPGSQGKPGQMKNPLYEYNFKTLQPWDGDSDKLVRFPKFRAFPRLLVEVYH